MGKGRGREVASNDFLQDGQATCGRCCLWEAGVSSCQEEGYTWLSRSPERPRLTSRLAEDSRKAPGGSASPFSLTSRGNLSDPRPSAQRPLLTDRPDSYGQHGVLAAVIPRPPSHPEGWSPLRPCSATSAILDQIPDSSDPGEQQRLLATESWFCGTSRPPPFTPLFSCLQNGDGSNVPVT